MVSRLSKEELKRLRWWRKVRVVAYGYCGRGLLFDSRKRLFQTSNPFSAAVSRRMSDFSIRLSSLYKDNTWRFSVRLLSDCWTLYQCKIGVLPFQWNRKNTSDMVLSCLRCWLNAEL